MAKKPTPPREGSTRALAHRLIGTPEQAHLFDDGSAHVTAPVRLRGIGIERSRQFGDVYLALALWRGLGLEELCEQLLPTSCDWMRASSSRMVRGELPRPARAPARALLDRLGIVLPKRMRIAEHVSAPLAATA
jgi:hypothetical protein